MYRVSLSSQPLVSVLVPTYRRPDMLERCLSKAKSALHRESHRFELLVGDNSDLPENRAITDAFAQSWGGRVRYFADASGRNMQDNWNHLAQEACGIYLQYVHDDDYLLPHAGEYLLAAARENRHEPVPVKFSIQVVTLDEREIRTEGSSGKLRLAPVDALRRLISESSYVRFPSMMIPRVQLLDVGGFDREARIQDWPTWIALAKRFGLEERPQPTAAYTIHAGAGTNRQFSDEYLKDLISILHVGAEGFDETEKKQLISKFLHRWILAGCYRTWKAGDMKSLVQRIEMLNDTRMREYPCPFWWLPLRGFLQLTASIAK
jgi:glycosyltransferase involved in cell wall biosynthesis